MVYRRYRMKKYDYLIVGAGLFGAVFAQEAKKAGKRVVPAERKGTAEKYEGG